MECLRSFQRLPYFFISAEPKPFVLSPLRIILPLFSTPGKIGVMLGWLLLTLPALTQDITPRIDRFGGSPFPAQEEKRLALRWETVRITVGESEGVVEARYVFKNLSNENFDLTLLLPLYAINTNVSFGRNAFPALEAMWDGEPVPFQPLPRARAINERATTYEKAFQATVQVRANATHQIQLRYGVSIGRKGLEHFIPYQTEGGRLWAGEIEVGDYSFRYDPTRVFSVIRLSPNWGWQWGETGAYARRRSFEPQEGERMELVFYAPSAS